MVASSLPIYNSLVCDSQAVDRAVFWVKDLFNENGQYNQVLIQNIFPHEISSRILSIAIEDDHDKLNWILHRSRNYSVGSGYLIAYGLFHEPLDHCPVILSLKSGGSGNMETSSIRMGLTCTRNFRVSPMVDVGDVKPPSSIKCRDFSPISFNFALVNMEGEK
ncbi:hypothetical protein PIB30_025152 [Stylosanthes scabra]|uniref:Uncharacterized protein n=1 Tax=Stylosanthes scabra TaxID=79078 RepID=A0ABU6X867_9FABA|nr:hypothetical protein [Stylosanthes scabra]